MTHPTDSVSVIGPNPFVNRSVKDSDVMNVFCVSETVSTETETTHRINSGPTQLKLPTQNRQSIK